MSILDEAGLSIDVNAPGKFTGDSTTELVSNGTFNSSLTGWTQNTDSGNCTITRNATYNNVVLTTNVGGAVTGNIYQDISVSGLDRTFHLTFDSGMSGFYATMQGRFAVYDNTNADWIIPRRNSWCIEESDTGGHTASIFFTIPDNTTSIRLYFYQNIDSDNGNTSYCWFDNISLVERISETDLRTTTILEIGAVDGYRHTIVADGGYDAATINFRTDAGAMADWMVHGLGNSVVVKDKGGVPIWEGFINEVKAQYGSTTVSVGPLLDVANRGRILYKTMDWATEPPVKGDSVKSVWFDNANSQRKFGVLEGTFSGGEGDVAEATQVIQTVVEETAWPEISHQLSLGGGDVSITLECKGWMHMLGKYYYYYTGVSGKQNVSAKISSVLSQDPNQYIDTSISSIATNTVQVAKWEDDDRTALVVIKELVETGDSTFNRYIWGVYANRRFKYEQQPTDVEYERGASDGVITRDGVVIPPWKTLPGKWMKISELVGNHLGTPETLRSDPSTLFIESVTYTAPYGLSITGAKEGKFKQRLARLGLVE